MDGDSDSHTTMNESDSNSAIEVILEDTEYTPHKKGTAVHPVRRSLIWRHYERLESQKAARCRICMRQLQCFKSGGTSNLRRHLLAKHPEEFAELVSDGLKPPPSYSSSHRVKANSDTLTPSDSGGATTNVCKRQFVAEVSLVDGDSGSHTTLNESNNNSAAEVILEATENTPQREGTDERLVRRSCHKQSFIWKYYERLDSLKAARCRICMKKLQCFQSGGTSNLRRHMLKRHPEEFAEFVADRLKPPPSYSSSHGPKANSDTLTPPENGGVTPQRQFLGSGALEGEKRVLRRERELIEALRRTQKEEAQALEHQRELLEKLRAADAREAAAEREAIESLRRAQQEEAKELSRQREELQKDKAELQKKLEELQRKREELDSNMTTGL